MKKVIIALVGLLLLTTASSCKKRQMKKLEKTLTEGSWRITYFTDYDTDLSTAYSSVVLAFHGDGEITIAGSNLTGTWKLGKSKSSKGGLFAERHIKLYIDLPDPFLEITDDWVVHEWSDTRVAMKDDEEEGDQDDNDFFIMEKL